MVVVGGYCGTGGVPAGSSESLNPLPKNSLSKPRHGRGGVEVRRGNTRESGEVATRRVESEAESMKELDSRRFSSTAGRIQKSSRSP